MQNWFQLPEDFRINMGQEKVEGAWICYVALMNYLTGDISEPIPACLQVIIDRLVAWHLIPPSKVPDSCSIHILDEVCLHYLLFVFQILQKCQLLETLCPLR
jgi:hypothetical protein